MEKCRKQLATLANSLCHNHNQNNNNNFQPYLTHRETYDCATCYHLLCEHRRQTVKSKFVSCEKQSKCGWQIFLQRQIFIYLQADAWAATCNAQIIIKHENANKIKYRDSVQHATAWLQQQQRAGKRLSARGDRYINMVNKVTPANRAGHSKQQQQQTNTHTHTQSCCARYPHKRACNKPQLCAALLWRVAATAATTTINAVKALQTIVVTLLYCFCCFYFCSCLFQANKLKFKKFGCRCLHCVRFVVATERISA